MPAPDLLMRLLSAPGQPKECEAANETYDVEVVSVSSVGETFPAVHSVPVSDVTAPTVSASPAAQEPVGIAVARTRSGPVAPCNVLSK